MSKKENKKTKKDKKGGDKDQLYKEPPKALIIGETFTSLLNPLTLDVPNLLLPVCGIPIIEFMLDSLSSSNIIKEIIICIKKRHDYQQLDKYLKRYHKHLNIKIIQNEEFESVGDCLRKIYAEKIISTDFVLIRGLVIINADIDELYNIHLQNKSKDKNCLITSIMKKFNNSQTIKTNYDENILIYDDNIKKIYQFEPTFQESNIVKVYKTVNNKKLNVNNNYVVRSDLFETGIEICSNEFLNIINENFEIKNIRDFIKNILVNEIYLNTFYLHELGKELYCGMIRNIESYLNVNFEILNRWGYPIVIDNIDISNRLKINLKQTKFSIYCHKDTSSENYIKANLISEVVILDKENIVEKDSKLQKCILCKDVKIGKNCDLYNCIIFKGTEIEDEVIIKNSIIGNNCLIKKGVRIISSVLGKNIIQEKDSIQNRIFKEEEDEDLEEQDKNESLTILDRDLFLKNLNDNDFLFLPNNSTLYGFNDEHLINDLNKKNENKENDNKNELNKKTFNYDSDEFFDEESISSEENSESSEEKEFEDDFYDVITDVISSGIDKKVNIDDLVTKLANLKKEYWNKTYEETIKLCLSIIIKKFLNGEKFSKKHIAKITKLFKDWKELFTTFIIDKDCELHLISVIEQLCIEIDEISSAFHILIQVLNSDECDIIGNEAILKWNKSNESYYTEFEGKVYISKEINENNKNKMKKYIETNLENNEEEEDNEDDEDDENDEDDN